MGIEIHCVEHRSTHKGIILGTTKDPSEIQIVKVSLHDIMRPFLHISNNPFRSTASPIPA